MKNSKYHTVGTDPKSNSEIVRTGKIDTLTQKFQTFVGMSTISRYNCKNVMGMSMILKFYYENDTGDLSPIHLEQNNTFIAFFTSSTNLFVDVPLHYKQ
jgi:hypothetical protein